MFLTHNNRVHFERLVEERFHAGRDHAGVFFAARRLPGEIVRRLLVILNAVTADEMKIAEPIPYALAVSLEVAPGLDVPIYEEMRVRLRPRTRVRP